MHLVSYVFIALAFGISDMLLFHRCAKVAPIRLSRGLVVAFSVAAIQTALFIAGMFLGNLLRFELPVDADAFAKTNSFVFIGLTIFVMLRILVPNLKRNPKPPLFNMKSNKACAAMAVASGINLFFVGIGAGFVASHSDDYHIAIWPMLIIMFLASYWGLMLGRRLIAIRGKVWVIVSSLLLFAVVLIALL